MRGALVAVLCVAALGATPGKKDKKAGKQDRSDGGGKYEQFWKSDDLHTIHVRVTPQQWELLQPDRNRGGRVPVPRRPVLAPPPPPPAASVKPTTRPATRPATVGQFFQDLVAPGQRQRDAMTLDQRRAVYEQALKAQADTAAARPPAANPAAPGDEPGYREGDRLEPNTAGFQFAYVKAQFEGDGIVMKDVGLRLRGNSSFNYTMRGQYNRPLKIDFNKFVDGQEFKGQDSLVLNNSAFDPSGLRDTLAYHVFRDLGAPAPRTKFTNVYLSIDGVVEREYLGLYTIIEEVDSKDFLKHHFGSSKGFLMKPWGVRGWPYLGEDWNAYVPRYNPETDPTPRHIARTKEFLKFINEADDETFNKRIEEYFDVEGFLSVVAGQVVLSNLDSILSSGHNFYLFLSDKDDRFHMMPWDVNLSFANYSASTTEQAYHLSVFKPHTGAARIIDRVLAIPKFRAYYRGRIERAVNSTINPAEFFPRIEALEAFQAGVEAQFPPTSIPGPVMGWRSQPAPPLRTFVTRRVESIRNQLAGETDGFTPGQRRAAALPPGGLRGLPAFGNVVAYSTQVLNGVDLDHDGVLTRKEVDHAIRAFFDDAQTRQLDQSRLTELLTPLVVVQNNRNQPPPQPRDRGGPRFLPPRNADVAAKWASTILSLADKSDAGSVTAETCLAAAEKLFTQYDKDNSKKLDVDELLLLLDGLATPPPATRPATRPAQPQLPAASL